MKDTPATNVLHGREGSYALLEVIGKGAYGTVYKGIWREVGRHVAVKRVQRSRLSAEEEKALQTEILLFKNLEDDHIVNYVEAVDDPDSAFLDIVMEFVEGGSLFNIVQSIRKSLDRGARVFEEPVVADFVRQVVLGLRYLHRQGVVHRDIKGANILVTKESHVKLTDFGVASTKPGADLSDSGNPIDVAGSPYWMAPEIITLTGSSTASDIWSLGCTVIELLTGFPPYHELSDITALFRIVSDECPPIPANLSADCEDFLHKCFNKDMHTRASAEELLSHRWIVRHDKSVSVRQEDDQKHPSANVSSGVGKSASSLLSKQSEVSLNTQTSLSMYEEDDDENFDDLESGEEDEHGLGGKDANAVWNDFHEPDTSYQSNDGQSAGIKPMYASSVQLSDDVRRLSIREDPFQDLMDDPEVDLERERLRRQKELWQLVKSKAAALGQDEETHVAACETLIEMFRTNPEQKYYLIYDPGLLPIIEVLEGGGNGSERSLEAMLRVTLSLLEDTEPEGGMNGTMNGSGSTAPSSSAEIAAFGYPRVSNIRQDLCLAGFLPVVMRYCKRSEPFRARILAARFLNKMLELEMALHMFIAYRGFTVFVDMLEPDIDSAGELASIALTGIDRMLSMENQRHKRDFCRRFAWCGLLDRIVDGISFNMDRLEKKAKHKKRDEEEVMRLEEHVTKLARLLQTFGARADPMVKAKMTKAAVLNAMMKQVASEYIPYVAVQSMLSCIRDLSRDPQTHSALQAASAIETLVEYLSVETGTGGDVKTRHFIISSLHNLCIVSAGRQEAAARTGVVPHLQRYIRWQDINLRSLCIDMYSGLGCAGALTRKELAKHNGVEFYVDLLVVLSIPGTVRKWQARVLQSLSEWLEDTSQSESVEEELVVEKNKSRICESLSKLRIIDVEGILEPYLKMITMSVKVNEAFGSSWDLISSMIRWLEEMYTESESLASGGPRERLLLLRTLLAHARLWSCKSDIRGLVAALRILLMEIVLVSDEAITVREQASLLLDELDRAVNR